MIADPTEPFFKNGGWAWDGSRWRKQPIQKGYSDRLVEDISESADGASGSTSSSAVPSGEIWFVQAVSLENNTRSGMNAEIRVADSSGTQVTLERAASLPRYTPGYWTGSILLKEGDYIEVAYSSTVAGDTLVGAVWGLIVNIDE